MIGTTSPCILAEGRVCHRGCETRQCIAWTVIYPHPDNAEHFKRYYKGTHVPLVRQLPGLKSCSYAYPAALGDAGGAPFCIFQAWFDRADAMGQALQSDMGKKVAADVPIYSPKGATLFHFAQQN